MMSKRIISFVCSILLILSFSACKKESSHNKTDLENNLNSTSGVVATVNGENLDEAYFRYYFTEFKNMVQMQYGESAWQNATLDGKPALEYVRERALTAAIEDKIIVNVAKNDGITLTDEDKAGIESTKQQWITQFGGEEAFVEAISSEYGLTLEQFNYMLEAVYYRGHVVNKYVDDSKTRDYYNNNIAKVKHILIPTVELSTNIPLTSGELKKAEEKVSMIMAEISNGTDFDSLVGKYTEDQNVFYYVGAGFSLGNDGSMSGGMVSEFETESLSLGIDEISGIVESPYGYHIIKRYQNDDAMYKLSKDTLATVLFTDVMEEWRNQTNVVINYDIYNSYN